MDKEYSFPDGNPEFRQAALNLAYGMRNNQDHIASMQTVSGTGALRMGLELIRRNFPQKIKKIYTPNVTWSLHYNIIEDAGFQQVDLRYYDESTKDINMKGFLQDLERISDEQVILIQTSCQNPCGIDPSKKEWAKILEVVKRKRHFIFFDSAYQGFGSDDTFSLRLFAESYPRIMLSQSFSKNFSLYGERTGCLSLLCSSPSEKETMQSVMKKTCLPYYSNPPIHGARIVTMILNHPSMRIEWENEVQGIRERLENTRS